VGWGRKHAHVVDLVDLARRDDLDAVALADAPVEDPDERDDALVSVVHGVEDQRPQRRVGVAARRGQVLDDPFQDGLDVLPRLRRDGHRVVRGDADDLLELRLRALDVGGGEVDLVDHGQDLEAVLDGQVGVLYRLGLDPLRRVHDQQHALAGAQGARDLVVEVDVSGCVDEVEEVGVPVLGGVEDPRRRGLDRDPALALELEGVEHLVAALARRHALRELEDPVGKRGLAVVDVRDDREVPDQVLHGAGPSLARPWSRKLPL